MGIGKAKIFALHLKKCGFHQFGLKKPLVVSFAPKAQPFELEASYFSTQNCSKWMMPSILSEAQSSDQHYG